MAEGAASFLVERLNELSDLIYITRKDQKELEDLRRDVVILKNFLRVDVDESWGSIKTDIRDVIFKLEDCVDIYLNKKISASRKKKIVRFRCLREGSRLAATDKFKSIREEVGSITEKITTWRPSPTQEEWETAIMDKDNLMRRDKVVGLEGEEAALIERILAEKEELDIITIIGMHGLGKTTMASKIYENERIAYEFPMRSWIHISPNFNKRDMLNQISKMFTRLDLSDFSDDELSEDTRQALRYAEFFLVLDDVCSHEDWESIQNILPRSNGRGKVLITTCVMNFGAQDGVYSHYMRLLTIEESWKLLQLEVFGDVSCCPMELESIGRDIAKKCDGLPLSVVTSGQVLRMSMDWEKLTNNLDFPFHNKEFIKCGRTCLQRTAGRIEMLFSVHGGVP